jgi:hypothetical protein
MPLLILVEMVGQSEDPPKKVGADLDGRFADPAVKMGGLFQDQNPKFRVPSTQKQGCGRAGQGSADDNDIDLVVLVASVHLQKESLPGRSTTRNRDFASRSAP